MDILKKLIEAPSVTPKDEGLLFYISELLKKNGFRVYHKEFGSGEFLTKNLYAEYGNNGKNLCFAGHVDVVPPGDLSLWTYPPFKLSEDNGKLYGRGMVDMKGSIYAMLESAIKWVKSKPTFGKISFLLTSDEEGDGEFGTKKMLEWLKEEGIKIDFSIVGEPTSQNNFGDMVKIGRRGSINFSLEINGIQGHVAYPYKAKNPCEIVSKILFHLINYKIDEGNSYFDPSNLEITSIDTGNNTRNIIPAKSRAYFNVRFADVKSSEQIISEIKDIIEIYSNDYKLEYKVGAEAFLSEKTEFHDEFKSIVETVSGVKTSFSTTGGTSDARYIVKFCPVLEFGLLNDTAHKVDEYTEISHLQKLLSVYYESIISFHKI